MSGDFSTQKCTAVSTACPVQDTIYGYYPNLAASVFGASVFALCCVGNLVLGWRYRMWTYMVVMCLGCALSSLGYGARILLHNNPWNDLGFDLQIVLLTISPAFNSAAIYIMIKHIIIRFGTEWSRVRPKFYTWVFVTADVLALILQGSGGGLAATAKNQHTLDIGDDLMIVGITWQVVTLLVAGATLTDYAVRRAKSPTPLSGHAAETWASPKFRIFASALLVLYLCILTRCAYRIGEMAGGWRNPIMRNEWLFVACDTCLMSVATLLQTFIHPGIFFPPVAEDTNDPQLGEKGADSIRSDSTDNV